MYLEAAKLNRDDGRDINEYLSISIALTAASIGIGGGLFEISERIIDGSKNKIKKLYGDDSIYYAYALSLLAESYRQKGDKKLAGRLFNRTIAMLNRVKSAGTHHFGFIILFYSRYIFEERDKSEAIEIMKISAEYFHDKFGKISYNHAYAMHVLADQLSMIGDFDQSIEAMGMSVDIYTEVLHKSHPTLRIAEEEMERIELLAAK